MKGSNKSRDLNTAKEYCERNLEMAITSTEIKRKYFLDRLYIQSGGNVLPFVPLSKHNLYVNKKIRALSCFTSFFPLLLKSVLSSTADKLHSLETKAFAQHIQTVQPIDF